MNAILLINAGRMRQHMLVDEIAQEPAVKKAVIVMYGGSRCCAVQCTARVEMSAVEAVLRAAVNCISARGLGGRFADLVSIIGREHSIQAKTAGSPALQVVDGSTRVGALEFDAGLLSSGEVLEYAVLRIG